MYLKIQGYDLGNQFPNSYRLKTLMQKLTTVPFMFVNWRSVGIFQVHTVLGYTVV